MACTGAEAWVFRVDTHWNAPTKTVGYTVWPFGPAKPSVAQECTSHQAAMTVALQCSSPFQGCSG